MRTQPGGLDVANAPLDTPGCTAVVHRSGAGAALWPQIVSGTVVVPLRREEQAGGYEAGSRPRDGCTSIASLLGAPPEEVAPLDGATRAWAEYNSNRLALPRTARRTGARVAALADVRLEVAAGLVLPALETWPR